MVPQVKTLFRMFIVVATISLFASSCKNSGQDPEALVGEVSKPAWAVPENYDFSSSMTAIVRVDLTKTYKAEQLKELNYSIKDGDLLAAFCGNTCLGIGKYKADKNAYWLYIAAPESGSGSQITIKHYSSVLKHIYTASETLPYNNGGNEGTPSEPYSPVWVVAE